MFVLSADQAPTELFFYYFDSLMKKTQKSRSSEVSVFNKCYYCPVIKVGQAD